MQDLVKIELATILDKKDPSRSVSVAGGFVEMRYYESILQDGIHIIHVL